MIDQVALKAALAEMLAAVATLPRADGQEGRIKLGYQGPADPLRAAIYFEFRAPNTGAIFVVDPAQLQAGALALREWITVRGGAAGGRESVPPGTTGGLGVAGTLRLLAALGIVPGLQLSALPGQPPPQLISSGGKPNIELLLQLLVSEIRKR